MKNSCILIFSLIFIFTTCRLKPLTIGTLDKIDTPKGKSIFIKDIDPMVALQLLNNDSVVGFLVGDFNNINCLIENKYYDKVGNNYPDLKLKQINEFNFDTCSCLKGSFVSFVSTEEMLKFKLPDNYLTKGARLRNNAYLYYISDTFRDNLLKIICFDYQRGKYYLFSSESGCYVQVDMRSSQN